MVLKKYHAIVSATNDATGTSQNTSGMFFIGLIMELLNCLRFSWTSGNRCFAVSEVQRNEKMTKRTSIALCFLLILRTLLPIFTFLSLCEHGCLPQCRFGTTGKRAPDGGRDYGRAWTSVYGWICHPNTGCHCKAKPLDCCHNAGLLQCFCGVSALKS